MSSVGSMSSMRRTVQSDEQMKERRHQCRHSRAPDVDTAGGCAVWSTNLVQPHGLHCM